MINKQYQSDLIAALSPDGILNTNDIVFKLQEIQLLLSEKGKPSDEKTMDMLPDLMDNTDASSLGFGRNPERSTRSSNDHHSKLCKYRMKINWSWANENSICI